MKDTYACKYAYENMHGPCPFSPQTLNLRALLGTLGGLAVGRWLEMLGGSCSGPPPQPDTSRKETIQQ